MGSISLFPYSCLPSAKEAIWPAEPTFDEAMQRIRCAWIDPRIHSGKFPGESSGDAPIVHGWKACENMFSKSRRQEIRIAIQTSEESEKSVQDKVSFTTRGSAR